MFSRKSWAKSKATNATLQTLKNMLNAIYRCDDYRYSELNGSLISLESRKRMKKISDDLDEWLKMEDNEK
jgi:hypothetical protein